MKSLKSYLAQIISESQDQQFSDLELAIMEGGHSLDEVTIDNKSGAGAVPYNQDVDYFGVRVGMKPSVFLKLAGPLFAHTFNESTDEPMRIKIGGNSSAAKSWIEKIYAQYPQTWQNNHVMPLGGAGDDQQFAMFELVPSFSQRGAVEVKWFQAYPLRAGVGSRAMKILQDLAREDSISLTLYPWDKGVVSQSKLIKFYKSQGFAPAGKGAKNMAWTPENVTEAETGTAYSDQVDKEFKALGYKQLGTGADSTVWAKDQGHVIKILMPDDMGSQAERVFVKFYEFCESHPNLSCLPVFNEHNKINILDREYTQIDMERLRPIKKNSFNEGVVWFFSDFVAGDESWDAVDHALGLADTWTEYNPRQAANLAKYWQDLTFADDHSKLKELHTLYGVMQILYKAGRINKFGWDLHTENVMQRINGQLVIIDPWFADSTLGESVAVAEARTNPDQNFKYESVVNEGGWASTATQNTIITPRTVAEMVEILKQFEASYNTWQATQGLDTEIKIGQPKGSGTYYKRDLAQDPDREYGDVDVECFIHSRAGVGSAARTAEYRQAIQDYCLQSPDYNTDNGTNVIMGTSDGPVQVDLIYTYHEHANWSRALSPEYRVKGVISASLTSALAEVLNLSFSSQGVQVKIRNGQPVSFRQSKDTQLRTVSTNPETWAKDIYALFYYLADGTKPESFPGGLEQHGGLKDEQRLSDIVLAIKALATALEQQGLLGHASLIGIADKKDMMRRVAGVYAKKLETAENSSKFDKAATPAAEAKAAKTKVMLAKYRNEITKLLLN